MKVLVVGSGGREHAIAWKLAQSPRVKTLYIAPGNAGTLTVAQPVHLKANEVTAIADWAEENEIDLTVIGPEEPLSLGIADEFRSRDLPVFGPVQAAAKMESSKAFSKEVMLAAGVRTAPGGVFTDFAKAEAFIRSAATPPVVKADGLATGKGVVVPDSVEEAVEAARDFLIGAKLGAAGEKVVLEERLYGREASVMAVISGDAIIPLAVSSDHKRIFDGDRGPNTGGMGAISPTPVLSEDRLDECVETIFRPVIAELRKRGIEYCGFLYAGIMVLPDGGLSVIEFNCRLGDPEAQVLMMRMQSDFAELLSRGASGQLAGAQVAWKREAAACVVIASEGYPGSSKDGQPIGGLFPEESDLIVFHAGTRKEAGEIFSKGGRVLGVTATGPTLPQALKRAYEGVERVSFRGMQFRRDIGVNR